MSDDGDDRSNDDMKGKFHVRKLRIVTTLRLGRRHDILSFRIARKPLRVHRRGAPQMVSVRGDGGEDEAAELSSFVLPTSAVTSCNAAFSVSCSCVHVCAPMSIVLDSSVAFQSSFISLSCK